MIISMPLFVIRPRKTKADVKMIFNLNNYRNWYYRYSNWAKQEYADIARARLGNFKALPGQRIGLTFTLYRVDRRKGDRANVLCIHEKFFCDAMEKAGTIPNDNDDNIAWTHYQTGPIDKINPRVEITITPEVP